MNLRTALLLLLLIPLAANLAQAAGAPAAETAVTSLAMPLESYNDPEGGSLLEVLAYRARVDSLNLTALIIFGCAIFHTFLTARIRHLAHVVEERHAARLGQRASTEDSNDDGSPDEVSFLGQMLHFLGEIEAVFGIWVVVLGIAITAQKSWSQVVSYIGEQVNYTEPLFVVIIMALAATRPVLTLAERCLRGLASLGGGTPAAWWLSILMVAPLLGSFITEPAAMTIAALLLARQFYALKPSPRLAYATLGLLFVNISVGGTLTHFAAPPVIMVAEPWGWDTLHMLEYFGWKAALGILISTIAYYLVFRRELVSLAERADTVEQARRRAPIPAWVTLIQLAFLGFTVWQAHEPPMFIGGFLFFLAFSQATAHHQSTIDLKPPILVGFFLAGLVIHGGLQAWWIEPVLRRLSEVPLFIGAATLTAFNDNAAITYLASQVPGFAEDLKYAVVAGAVAGGGLTVIANAPNPAGQAILGRFFPDGVTPLGLVLGALPPTIVVSLCFILTG